jgi:hypothetical protein
MKPIAKYAQAICLSLALFTTACSKKTHHKKPYVPDFPQKTIEDQRRERGSLLQGKGLLGGLFGSRKDSGSNGILGVNAYAWRAALDVITLPSQKVDPFAGLIITDWYTTTPSERLKIEVKILSDKLTADTVRVVTFKQHKTKSGWHDKPTNRDAARQIEDNILRRAQRLRHNDHQQFS